MTPETRVGLSRQTAGPGESVDDFADLRWSMVETQLRDHGISNERVLDAMRRVPREEFVPEDLRYAAYEDGPLPIGFGQTISQPFTVAFMCQALRLAGNETVLEIGTGSGYGAAVLSFLAARVFTIERIPQLSSAAQARLAGLGRSNVEVITGDGTAGLPRSGPFDAIVVTAGASALPHAYIEQLRHGGRIVIPIGEYRYNQEMYRFTRLDGQLKVESLGSFAFVPLVGNYEGESVF